MAHTAADFKTWINGKGPWTRAHLDPAYSDFPMSKNKLGALVGHLNDICGGDRERRSLLKYLFGVDSSAALTCRQKNALYLWIEPKLDETTQTWSVGNPHATATAALVLREVLVAAGQQALPF